MLCLITDNIYESLREWEAERVLQSEIILSSRNLLQKSSRDLSPKMPPVSGFVKLSQSRQLHFDAVVIHQPQQPTRLYYVPV